ncbi:MAG TPA: type III polyketide synthase [Bradyrhizobium sp.]|nr:type III polyketide synthase [Bradyrhizobium sp.]
MPAKSTVPMAALVSLATSVPPHVFLQKDILAAAWEVFGPRLPQFETLSSIFTNTGILKRHGVKPFGWYLQPRSWPERTQAFLEGAEALFIDVAEKALANAQLSAGDIDTVVTVCSTGIATPSLEARIAGRIGLRSDVSRVPVFGLGCAGGVSGVSIAARLAQARPGSNVLLVALELCSLAIRLDELTKANIVATSLFGDGAAALILRAGDGGETLIEHSGEHLWPDTLGIMGWNVDPEGFGVIFQRTIPDFVAEHLNPAVTKILAGMQLSIADIDRFICHPGGARVIHALETALILHQGTLDHERQVIADCGNMSAPTVLFVLERVRRQGLPRRSMLTALGPGFTASCVALRQAA